MNKPDKDISADDIEKFRSTKYFVEENPVKLDPPLSSGKIMEPCSTNPLPSDSSHIKSKDFSHLANQSPALEMSSKREKYPQVGVGNSSILSKISSFLKKKPDEQNKSQNCPKSPLNSNLSEVPIPPSSISMPEESRKEILSKSINSNPSFMSQEENLGQEDEGIITEKDKIIKGMQTSVEGMKNEKNPIEWRHAPGTQISTISNVSEINERKKEGLEEIKEFDEVNDGSRSPENDINIPIETDPENLPLSQIAKEKLIQNLKERSQMSQISTLNDNLDKLIDSWEDYFLDSAEHFNVKKFFSCE